MNRAEPRNNYEGDTAYMSPCGRTAVMWIDGRWQSLGCPGPVKPMLDDFDPEAEGWHPMPQRQAGEL